MVLKVTIWKKFKLAHKTHSHLGQCYQYWHSALKKLQIDRQTVYIVPHTGHFGRFLWDGLTDRVYIVPHTGHFGRVSSGMVSKSMAAHTLLRQELSLKFWFILAKSDSFLQFWLKGKLKKSDLKNIAFQQFMSFSGCNSKWVIKQSQFSLLYKV